MGVHHKIDTNKVRVMSTSNVKEDPIKLHKQAISLMEDSKYEEARDLFIKTGELYYKSQNYFGAAEMFYKAGEAAFALKDNEKAAELFMKSSEISFSKAFDRYGVSALEYARDCFTALGNQEKVEELTKKIKEVNQKLNESSGSDEDQSFSVFS
jgi:tetratricopeptide (TPR) repeat protein